MAEQGRLFVVPEQTERPKDASEREWLEAFPDFWNDYPRRPRVGKHAAQLAWIKVKPWDQETCDAIFAGLERWIRHWREIGTECQYMPYASTWLNQRRWIDELD